MDALMDGSMHDLAMLILLVVVIVFVIVLIILVVHFIGTARKVNKTIDEIQPTIDAANKVLEDIQPAVKRVDPLIERVSLTVDAVNLEIMRADTILSDISEVTSTATGAVTRVAEITDAPLNLLNTATDKVRDLFGSSKERRQAEKVVRRSAERGANPGGVGSGEADCPDPRAETKTVPVSGVAAGNGSVAGNGSGSVAQGTAQDASESLLDDSAAMRQQALEQIYADQESGVAPKSEPAVEAHSVPVDRAAAPPEASTRVDRPAPVGQSAPQGFTALSLDETDTAGRTTGESPQGGVVQGSAIQGGSVQVDYIPDFEPDDVTETPGPAAGQPRG